MSDVATRSSFLTGCKRRYGTLTLSSGVTVRYQSLSEAEDAEYQMQLFVRDATGLLLRDENGNLVRDDIAIANERSRLIVMCLVDADGNRMLCEGDIAQVDQLDGADTRALYRALMEHCGFIERREAKKKRLIDEFQSRPRKRLHYRLAAYVAHTLDVHRMLASVPPEQIDEWEAFDALEPIGTHELFQTLARLGCTLAASKGVEAEESYFAPCLQIAKREPTSAEQLRELRRDMLEAYGD